jgi:hypothetical protein
LVPEEEEGFEKRKQQYFGDSERTLLARGPAEGSVEEAASEDADDDDENHDENWGGRSVGLREIDEEGFRAVWVTDVVVKSSDIHPAGLHVQGDLI